MATWKKTSQGQDRGRSNLYDPASVDRALATRARPQVRGGGG